MTRNLSGSAAAGLLLSLVASGCDLNVATSGDGGVVTPRCSDCTGADGGPSALPGIEGQTVTLLETSAPSQAMNTFILQGTVPVPPHTFPRSDGKDPFLILDWDGTPLQTQTEIVSRYPRDADGADVVEVLAKVRLDPAVQGGDRIRYPVVFSPHAAPSGPGTVGLEDLLATSSLPGSIQAILGDPSSIEIATYDCFGNKYACRPLDGTGTLQLMRHGRVQTEMRIFQVLRPEPPVSGPSGTLPHSLGVHVYLSTLSGHDILGFALRFTNGSSGHDASTTLDDPLDKLYFQKIQVSVPAGLNLVQDFQDPFLGGFVVSGDKRVWDLVEPLPGGKMHVMRWLGQFHRRLWLSGSEAGFASAYSTGNGVGFCQRGTDSFSGRDYWSWWNRGTARYFPQKYLMPSLDHAGLQNIRGQLFAENTHLTERLLNGTSDGNYPIASGVLGWGHPYGVSYGGMTSGSEIFCWDGITTAASASAHGILMHRALHRMHSDRQPNVLVDLDGEPTSVERWLVENGAQDYVPFYHYIVPFLGGSYPDPFGFAQAPRFQINHVAANSLAADYEGAHLAFDPHDFQHLIRYTRSAKVLAWLNNDSIAKDDLRTQAEMFNLSFHSFRNDQYGGSASSGLRSQQLFVNANPGKGSFFGRGEAWGLDTAAAAHSLGTPAWRAAKRPWFAEIIEMLAQQQGVCNGFLQAQVSNKALDGKYRARQQIEQSITENALQALRECVFRGADPGHADVTADVLTESLYGFISGMAWSAGNGPWRYSGIGPKEIAPPIWCSFSEMPSDAVTTGDYETYQDWSSFAYGYELTGDPIFLERALEQLFGTADLYTRLRNEGVNNIENRSALLALVQHLNGDF